MGKNALKSGMFGLTGYDILGWILFGGAGMLACAWGKMKELWQPWVLGLALMFFPYVIPSGLLMWGVGLGLTTAVFFAKN